VLSIGRCMPCKHHRAQSMFVHENVHDTRTNLNWVHNQLNLDLVDSRLRLTIDVIHSNLSINELYGLFNYIIYDFYRWLSALSSNRIAYQTLHRLSRQAHAHPWAPTWLEYYDHSCRRSNQIYINQWYRMNDILTCRYDSLHEYQQ
jgi:hypothetical protein